MTAPSYASGTSSVPLLGETIGENLRRTVERFGEREAVVVPHQRYRATYREFWQQTTQAARGLLAHGVKKGDRVGIWSPNRSEWVVVQYATARIGAILVNINPAYKTAEEWAALNQASSMRDMGTHLCALPTGEYCPKGLVCLGCGHAQPKKSAVPIFRSMLASHLRALDRGREIGEPAGQIAARELEVERIRSALRRAEDLSEDVAVAIEAAAGPG